MSENRTSLDFGHSPFTIFFSAVAIPTIRPHEAATNRAAVTTATVTVVDLHLLRRQRRRHKIDGRTTDRSKTFCDARPNGREGIDTRRRDTIAVERKTRAKKFPPNRKTIFDDSSFY